MRTVNKVILIGNITKDPYIKNTENSKKVALFTLATNRYFKNLKGEVKNEAEYTNCIAWGSLAERCEKFLLKGKLVYIEGRLKTRMIEKEDGIKLYKTEIVVSNLIFLNKKSEFETDEAIEEDFVADIEEDDKF
ncbi:MAG: single-stranded DNA-binding protein [Candidatus Gracilibacteria bacterium]|nr:single-stranded DNA-binding protein [Candidatus Gracilibacteria bacterium]